MLLNFIIDSINLVLPEPNSFTANRFCVTAWYVPFLKSKLSVQTHLRYFFLLNSFLFLVGYISGYSYYELKLGIVIFFRYRYDTLSSIPVPERYFFRYQFFGIILRFNKITLSQKTLFFREFYFFSLLTFIQSQYLISWATAQGTKYIQHNKSVQIVLIKV